jgi:hypothetical protein
VNIAHVLYAPNASNMGSTVSPPSATAPSRSLLAVFCSSLFSAACSAELPMILRGNDTVTFKFKFNFNTLSQHHFGNNFNVFALSSFQ